MAKRDGEEEARGKGQEGRGQARRQGKGVEGGEDGGQREQREGSSWGLGTWRSVSGPRDRGPAHGSRGSLHKS